MNMDYLVWGALGYLFGSIPFGYVVSKAKGVDITKKGSGNIGGANVYRVLGLKYAALVGFLDVLKGFVPTHFALTYSSPEVAFFTAAMAVLGAVFSVFLKFRGGKGMATATGGYLALAAYTNTWIALPVLLTTWLTVIIAMRISALANIVTLTTAVPLHVVVGNIFLAKYMFFVLLVVLYSHRANIQRMLEGKELRVVRLNG